MQIINKINKLLKSHNYFTLILEIFMTIVFNTLYNGIVNFQSETNYNFNFDIVKIKSRLIFGFESKFHIILTHSSCVLIYEQHTAIKLLFDLDKNYIFSRF